jgi:hypothetical protein
MMWGGSAMIVVSGRFVVCAIIGTFASTIVDEIVSVVKQ